MPREHIALGRIRRLAVVGLLGAAAMIAPRADAQLAAVDKDDPAKQKQFEALMASARFRYGF